MSSPADDKKDIDVTGPSAYGKTRIDFDNPELDGTDFAHPAWWRGEDHGIKLVCQKINEVLDGRHGIPVLTPLAPISGDPKEAYAKLLQRVMNLTRTLDALSTIAGYLKERADDGTSFRP